MHCLCTYVRKRSFPKYYRIDIPFEQTDAEHYASIKHDIVLIKHESAKFVQPFLCLHLLHFLSVIHLHFVASYKFPVKI